MTGNVPAEASQERLLDTGTIVLPSHAARYLAHSDLLAWDPTTLADCVLDEQFCTILHTIAILERDTSISLRQARAFGLTRSADLSVFLPVWASEEAEHARALRYLLAGQTYVPPRLPLRNTSLRRRSIASVPMSVCGLFPPVGLVFCAMGAAAEYVTIMTYGELARALSETAAASLLQSIARQERRHFTFFLAAARERAASMSRGNGFVARRLFDRLWQPPGVPSIGFSAWQNVFAPFLASQRFRERARGMDRVIDTIPHLEGMNLMQKFLQNARVRPSAP